MNKPPGHGIRGFRHPITPQGLLFSGAYGGRCLHGRVLLYLPPIWLETGDGYARFRDCLSYGHHYVSCRDSCNPNWKRIRVQDREESVFKVGFFKNKLVLLGIVSELAIIATLVYTPFSQRIFGLAPLDLKQWGFLFAFTRHTLLHGRREKVDNEKVAAVKLSRVVFAKHAGA